MKIFRDYTMTWWQVSLLKASVLLVGLAFGAYFAPELIAYFWQLLVAGLVVGVYLAFALL